MCISQLKNLEELSLTECGLRELPPEIGALSNLRVLRLGFNELKTLPAEIGQLTELRELRLEGNQLSSLPPELASLEKLEVLGLSGNQFETMPEVAENFRNLEVLALGFNPLEQPLPESLLGPRTFDQAAPGKNRPRHRPFKGVDNAGAANCGRGGPKPRRRDAPNDSIGRSRDARLVARDRLSQSYCAPAQRFSAPCQKS